MNEGYMHFRPLVEGGIHHLLGDQEVEWKSRAKEVTENMYEKPKAGGKYGEKHIPKKHSKKIKELFQPPCYLCRLQGGGRRGESQLQTGKKSLREKNSDLRNRAWEHLCLLERYKKMHISTLLDNEGTCNNGQCHCSVDRTALMDERWFLDVIKKNQSMLVARSGSA